MSTTRPRITVTLQPHSHRVLSRLAELSGDSMSEIVCGFVDLAVPSLERVVVLMQRAKDAPQEVKAGVSAAIDRAESVMLPQLQSLLAQNDLFIEDVGQALKRPAGPVTRAKRAAPVPVDAQTPGPVTRGSGLKKPAKPKGASSAPRTPKGVGHGAL